MRLVINWVLFANGMPRFQEQSTRPQGTAVYDLDFIKIKLVVAPKESSCHMWGRLFCVLLFWISVLWMFDRCKVFHSFYNWFYTRHQLTGLDRICPSISSGSNRLDGFMSNIYVELSQSSCNFFKDSLKIGQSNKASVALWLIILGLILCFRWFGSWAAF